MSTTMEGIDARGYLLGWTKGVTSMFIADVNAIPDDKWTATFGGCTRPANDLVADTLGLLVWCTEVMKGNTPTMDPESNKALAAQLTTKAIAVEKTNEITEAFCGALAGASDTLLNSEIMAPWGMPTPVFMLAQIAVSHIWYHDGQLNYVHCLLGDNKVYWMGG